MIALVNLLPESPFYHLMKNNEIKAKDSLKWYRGRIYEDVEMEELKYLVSHSGKVKRFIFIKIYDLDKNKLLLAIKITLKFQKNYSRPEKSPKIPRCSLYRSQ